MKVGLIGSGDVAKTLGSGFLKHGHGVTMGTRAPAKLADWAEQNPKGHIGSFADAAKFGELVVLAVKGTAALDALRAANAANLAGKPVIDATNPIADAPPSNGVLKFFTNLDESLMERLQREFGNVRFVKAFNSVGNASMVNPQFKGGQTNHVHLRERRGGEEDRERYPRSVWLGDRGHGQSRGGPCDRATMHALVYPRLPPQRLGSRV
jgi:8-hydroxy-5-deazaflavin:NADPH oxidoreductase